VYDPADGNLLLTVTVTGPLSPGPYLYLNEAPCGPQTVCPPGSSVVSGNAYFGSKNGGNALGGLVTGFEYDEVAATPEPVSSVLAMSGIVILAFGKVKLQHG
jgi:hypothetical protein